MHEYGLGIIIEILEKKNKKLERRLEEIEKEENRIIEEIEEEKNKIIEEEEDEIRKIRKILQNPGGKSPKEMIEAISRIMKE